MQRAIFEDVLSPAECRELIFILKSCGVVGYRPHVISCTPQDLIASNSAPLVLPLLTAAARVQQLVEGRFGKECELFTEFVGLISWKAGASIGWHHDSNREYLRQRHYSAVCYLNNQSTEFVGGTFRFRDGQPDSVAPVPGHVVAYSSGEENTHAVDPVTRGERITLALWFTTDPDYFRDGILLPQLQSALQRALSSIPGGSFHAGIPYPIDPPDTFFVEPEAWSREAGPFDGAKEFKEGVSTDPDSENGSDAVVHPKTNEQIASLQRSHVGSFPTDEAERQKPKRARFACGADAPGMDFEEGSEPEESGGGLRSFAEATGDVRCERLRDLGLRFVSESGMGRDVASPDAVLWPGAVQPGEARQTRHFATSAGQAPVAAGVCGNVGDAGNAPGSGTAGSPVVGVACPGRSGSQCSEAELGSRGKEPRADAVRVRLQWLGGEAFNAEFRSTMHALQVLYHFVECVEAPLPTAAPPKVSAASVGETTGLTEESTVNGNRACKSMPPTENFASLLRVRTTEAMQMWEAYSRSKWQHLQGVLQQWSSWGFFTNDVIEPVVLQHLC